MKTMKSLIDYLKLPAVITPHERAYLQKTNRAALAICALHVPLFVVIAAVNGTGPVFALVAGLAILTGPALAYFTLANPRLVSITYGVTAAFYGALLVHVGQGPIQIEMHFYFFAIIATLVVFANPLVIVAATVTIALHHLAFWFLVPKSVFNYAAPIWVVAIHALFVVIEAIAACYTARTFFDNVLGLEKIIASRTAQLNERNQELRLVFDAVRQGFATVDKKGHLSAERSRVFRAWFGDAESAVEAFRTRSPEFAERFELGWGEVVENFLPADLLLDQLPKVFDAGESQFRVAYDPIGESETAERWLVVVTDVTSEVQQERLELERREVFQLFEQALVDRTGVSGFLDEATALIDGITRPTSGDLVALKRRIHTLKGNSAIYGVDSIATMCHDMETHIAAEAAPPPRAVLSELSTRWTGISDNIERMIGAKQLTIELELHEYQALEREARRVSVDLFTKIHNLRLEPVRRRLDHFGEQAKRIAERLDKAVDVTVEDNDIRLDPRAWAPFWNAFIHSVRNAVDHGIESKEARRTSGKAETGKITLRTRVAEERFIVEICDDGRGIEWELIRGRAFSAGIPCETPEDLLQALFRDGLSTAKSVTDISGRGIGMGALLDAATALEGKVCVETVVGSGTLVRISFPLSALLSRESESMRVAHAAE